MELTETNLSKSVGGIAVISELQGPPLSFRGPVQPAANQGRVGNLLETYLGVELERLINTPRYPTSEYVGALILYRDGGCGLFFAGVQNRGQFPRIAVGYANANSPANPIPGWNFVVAAEVRSLLENIGQVLSARRYVDLYGHSLGGMFAECVASEADSYGITIGSIFTYGTPKPAQVGYFSAPRNLRRFRWMADGDPVPLLPFGRIGGLQEYILATIALARSGQRIDVNRWRHANEGIAVGNTSIRASLEPRGLDNPAGILQRWMAGESSDVANHEAEHYRRLLLSWYDARTPITSIPRRQSLPAEPINAQRLVMPFRIPDAPSYSPDLVLPLVIDRSEESRFVQTISLATTTDRIARGLRESVNISNGVNDMANAKLAPGAGFVRVKIPNGQWEVYLGGSRVAIVSSGSRAKTVVKKGNAFLRYMNNLAWETTTGDSLAAAMANYFEGIGYTPALTHVS